MATSDTLGNHIGPPGPVRSIDGEPDPVAGTLAEWRAWRQSLAGQSQNEPHIQVSIAVADARIEILSRRD
jgi:hypothetical protein